MSYSTLEQRVDNISKDLHIMAGAMTEVQKNQSRMLDQHDEVIKLMARHEATNERIADIMGDLDGLGNRVEDLTRWRFGEQSKTTQRDWWLVHWKSFGVLLAFITVISLVLIPGISSIIGE